MYIGKEPGRLAISMKYIHRLKLPDKIIFNDKSKHISTYLLQLMLVNLMFELFFSVANKVNMKQCFRFSIEINIERFNMCNKTRN